MAISNAFKNKETTTFSSPERQSMGILDDFAVRKDIATLGGTIEKVPVNDNDIVNKAYCDSNAGGGNPFDQDLNTTDTPQFQKLTIGNTSEYPYKLLLTETGFDAETSAVLLNDSQKGRCVSMQGNGGAYFMGRDLTNDIEFIMGTSILGASFAGSVTDHDFQLRTNNVTNWTIKTDGTFSGTGTISGATIIGGTKISGAYIIGTTISGANLVCTGLTATRIPYVTTNGVITSNDDLTVASMGISSPKINLIQHAASSTTGGGTMILGQDDGAAIDNTHRLGLFLFGGAYTASAFANAAAVECYADGAWTSTSTPTSIIFKTTPSGSIGAAGTRQTCLTIDATKKATFAGDVAVTGDIAATTYHVGATAGIDATVSYTDTILGAKTLTFTKGILTAQT